jgi:hypothetical protein
MQPEHAQAYLLGLHKLFGTANGKLRHVELAHTLEKPTNTPTRPVPTFYTHSYELQGYTNRGQMIGAGIGPQADSQFLAVDLFHANGCMGLWVERVLRNDPYFRQPSSLVGPGR